MTKLTLPALALLIGASALGCGKHRSEDTSDESGKSGGGGGHAGNAAGAGTSGSGGTSSPSVTCGDQTCTAPPDALSQLAGGFGIPGIPIPTACCVDTTAGSVCGTAPSATGTCAPRAVADSQCPSLDPGFLAQFAGGKIAGCCTDRGACGVDAALFGLGCTENSVAATMIAAIPVLGTTIKVPASQSCVTDAGVADAASGEDAGL
jgi:hypothetical protein